MERKQLLEQFLSSKESQEILHLLEVTQYLLVRYWKKLHTAYFLKGLWEINEDLADLIKILDHVELLDSKPLAQFIRDFKKASPIEQANFYLKANDPKIIEPLEKFLKKKFWKYQIDYEHIDSDNLTVDMKWHWYSFKRSLDSDIDKILV